eukprot:g27811.t1
MKGRAKQCSLCFKKVTLHNTLAELQAFRQERCQGNPTSLVGGQVSANMPNKKGIITEIIEGKYEGMGNHAFEIQNQYMVCQACGVRMLKHSATDKDRGGGSLTLLAFARLKDTGNLSRLELEAKLRNLRDMDLDEAVRQRAVDKVERQLAELREDDMGSGVPDDFLEEAKAVTDGHVVFLDEAVNQDATWAIDIEQSVARGITSNSVQNRYLDILESLKLKAFLMNAEKESQVMDSSKEQDEAILLLLAEEAAAKAAASRPVAEYGLRLIKQARIRQDDAKERKRRVALLRRWVEENWQGQAPEELIAHAHVEEPREPRPPRRDGAVQSLVEGLHSLEGPRPRDLADAIELKPLERKRFISAVEEGLKEEEELVEMEESPLAEDDEWVLDLQRALRESLETASARHGTPLGTQALRDMNIYFECQTPGSDTCGLNALNNLCQRPLFSVEDLQHAEAQHAQVTQGGHFCQRPSLTEVPSGFFDVEALKIAAAAKDLEIVDVEPVSDFRTSRCFSFAEAAAQSMQSSGSGAFLLGFLVYDRQPGQMMLGKRRNVSGGWCGGEPRNCLLKEQELWEVYSSCQPLFQSWLLRWYPVVYRKAAVRQVCHVLQERFRHRLSPERATSVLKDSAVESRRSQLFTASFFVLKENGWLVSAAVHHLLETLPVLTLRHLLVKFARPSEAEMQSLLEASGWDLTRAQPAIDRVLKQRIALAKQVDAGETTVEALSLCDWEPRGAAALLALQLHLGEGSSLVELKEALEWAEGEAEKAEAVVKLKAQLGSMESAAKLLHQTHTWSVATDTWTEMGLDLSIAHQSEATKVLEVRRRFPRANVPVALEVLRRNDDDPHAACEMLEEFRQRIRRTVSEEWDHYLLQGEEAMVADAALDRCVKGVSAMGSALSTEELRSVTSALQKLSEKDKKVQEKAAAEVCEMADDEEMRKEIMKPEMLTALMKGGQLGSPKARKIVVRTTMVLADHSPSRCKMLIKAGAMDVLHSLALAKKSTSEAKRLVANCAWQLLRYDHEVNNIDNMPEDPQLIEALVCCVKSAAKEGKERASDVLRWLGKKETNRAKIVEASGLETLARLARCGTQRERSSAQRALEELDETTIEDKSGKARAESRRKAFRPFSLYRMLPSRMWTLLGWRAKRMQEAAFKDASITPLEGSHLSFNTPSQVAAMDAPQALVPAVSFSTAKRPPDSVRRRWQRLSCEAEVEDEDSEEYMIDMPEDPQVIKDFVCSVKSEAGEGKAGATEVEDVVDASLDSLQTLACFGTDEQKNFAEQTLKELLVGEFSSAIEQLKDDDEKVQEEAAAKLCDGRNATPAPLTATTIQSGKGTPVAMFSLRFDGGEVEKNFRAVHALLQAYEYDVLMVDADAGDNFGILTTEYLSRVKNENGVMLAVCTETYGDLE